MLVTLCIMMQVVVMLPHHHHEGSGVPCVNMFHRTDGCAVPAEKACDCCGHGQLPARESHNHDTDVCVLSHFEMIHPVRERIAGPAEIAALPVIAQAVHICTVHDINAAACRDTINQLDRKRLRVEVPLPRSYIARAIPPRAPSFTV